MRRLEVPAVVVGAGANGLGVARSLARARVPVWLLDSDPWRAEMRTRAARPLKIGALQGETLVQDLDRLGAAQFSGLRPVLFLTQEDAVKTVSHQRDRLSDMYRFSLPSMDVTDALMHKHGFQLLAEQLGGPIPPLVHVRTTSDLATLKNLRYPAVVKPGARYAEYGKQFKKAYRVESVPEAADLVGRILAVAPDVVVQEWIEGADSNIYFCLQYLDGRGDVAASFTGRKIRSWPPHIGGTASCTAAPEADAELSRLTAQFFRGAGVVGMASMEYKQDARTHEFRMVEPTIGRSDYQEEVATLNGVNVPYAAYCSELGLPSPAAHAVKRPVVWRVRSEDARSAALQGQRPNEGFPDGSRVVDALWRWRDPWPSVAQTACHIRRALRTRVSRILLRSQTAGGKS